MGPEPYDHTNTGSWPAIFGVLKYIYEREVVNDKFLQPSDFFMHLYSRAVIGNAKEMITGQVEEMMINGETGDAVSLLKVMDNMFRNRNADKTASNLLYACRQFKDNSLSLFLPRFQTILTRSPISNMEDNHKSDMIEKVSY